MRMWSRGLGKDNLGLSLVDAKLKTIDEALSEMPEAAKLKFIASVDGRKHHMMAVTGKVSPPVGWEYVILLERKDVFALAWKMLSTLKTLKLFIK